MIGFPVSFALIFSGCCMMFTQGLFDPQIVAQQMIGGTNTFSLIAVPFFVLAGEAMNKGGISIRIVNAASALVGHIRGGLGYVAILSSIIFAGLSGSAIADTAALGGVLIPMMIADGYSKERSTGLVVCSAIIANIIPPSIGFILYGVASGTSITRLFMGGLIPGVIIGLSLMVVWFFVVRKDNLKPHSEKKTLKEMAKVMWDSILALILPIIIVVGLRMGFFTPTEAGSVAAAYALFVGIFVYKKIKFTDLFEIFCSTVRTTASVMMIVAGATVAAWAITACNLSRDIVSTFSGLNQHPVVFMLICQLIFLLFGMVMDLGPIVMIMVPVLMPLVKEFGIDPTYFGIVMIINLTFGLVTPPVGTVLYVGSGISKIGIADTVRGAWPFMLAEIVLIFLFSVFPQIILVPLNLIIG